MARGPIPRWEEAMLDTSPSVLCRPPHGNLGSRARLGPGCSLPHPNPCTHPTTPQLVCCARSCPTPCWALCRALCFDASAKARSNSLIRRWHVAWEQAAFDTVEALA